ncbi:hypothetical protein FRC12_019917 [Ceratobasidium sp. 428]|nr:hypothetical protein FRC12_019917 [Ceratobasidium sp. 428]
MASPTGSSHPEQMSPLNMRCGWIQSAAVSEERFATIFLQELSPWRTVCSQLQDQDLPGLASSCPAFYTTVVASVTAVAERLDHKDFPKEPGLQSLLFPNLQSAGYNGHDEITMQNLIVDLRLLDKMLGYAFPSLLAPEHQLDSDDQYKGVLGDFPTTGTPWFRAVHLVRWWDKTDSPVKKVLDRMSLESASLAETATPDTSGVVNRLSKLIAYHKGKQQKHEFLELVALIAKGLYIVQEKLPVSTPPNKQAAAMLRFISSTRILVPFLRLFFNVKHSFTIREVTLVEAYQNTHQPEFNRSTPLLLEIESVLWAAVFDTLFQCQQPVFQIPSLNWDAYHMNAKNGLASFKIAGWRWPKRSQVLAKHINISQGPAEHGGSHTEPEVAAQGAKELNSESEPEDPQDKIPQTDEPIAVNLDVPAPPENPDRQMVLRKRRTPPAPITNAPVTKKAKTSSSKRLPQGRTTKKITKNVPAKHSTVPLFKQEEPEPIDEKEQIELRQIRWNILKSLKDVKEEYQTPKVCEEH